MSPTTPPPSATHRRIAIDAGARPAHRTPAPAVCSVLCCSPSGRMQLATRRSPRPAAQSRQVQRRHGRVADDQQRRARHVRVQPARGRPASPARSRSDSARARRLHLNGLHGARLYGASRPPFSVPARRRSSGGSPRRPACTRRPSVDTVMSAISAYSGARCAHQLVELLLRVGAVEQRAVAPVAGALELLIDGGLRGTPRRRARPARGGCRAR